MNINWKWFKDKKKTDVKKEKKEDNKILGLYSFYMTMDDDTKKIAYCYVEEDAEGKREYKFTDDKEFAIELGAKYANSHKYERRPKGRDGKKGAEELMRDPNFRIGKNTASNINVMINNAPAIEKKDFQDVCDAYNNFKEKYNKKDKKNAVKKDDKKTDNDDKVVKIDKNKNKKRRWKFVATVVAATLVISGIGLFLSRRNSPTNKGSVVATVDDLDDQINDIKNQANNEAQAAAATTNTNTNANASTNTNGSSSTYSSSGGSSSSYGGGSYTTTPTRAPGEVDNSYLGLQDSNASLPEQGNNNDNNNENQETDEGKYDNVMTGEEEVTDDKTDNDYSEEMEVPASDDEISEGDISWEVDQDAVEDGSLTYVDGSQDGNTSSDENTNSDLPDPNDTASAGDGNYDTTEEELQQSQGAVTEEVPVEQETNTEEVPVTQNTTTEQVPTETQQNTQTTQASTGTDTSTTTTNEDVAQAAVDAMAAGEDVTYDANSNTFTTNEVPVEQAEATTSLGK